MNGERVTVLGCIVSILIVSIFAGIAYVSKSFWSFALLCVVVGLTIGDFVRPPGGPPSHGGWGG